MKDDNEIPDYSEHGFNEEETGSNSQKVTQTNKPPDNISDNSKSTTTSSGNNTDNNDVKWWCHPLFFWFIFTIIAIAGAGISTYLLSFYLCELSEAFSLLIAIIAIFLSLLGIVVKSLAQVPQKEEWIIEVLGKYAKKWKAGPHLLTPLLDLVQIRSKSFMGQQIMRLFMDDNVKEGFGFGSVEFQDCSAPVTADVIFTITDSKKVTYEVGELFKIIEERIDSGIRSYYGPKPIDDAIKENLQTDLKRIFPDSSDGKENLVLQEMGKVGVTINNIVIPDIKLPPNIIKAREKVLDAKKEVEKTELEIIQTEKEREKTIIKADAKRQALEKEADGYTFQIEKMVEKTKLSPQEVSRYLIDRVKWENIGDKTVIIDESGGRGPLSRGIKQGIGQKAFGDSNQKQKGGKK